MKLLSTMSDLQKCCKCKSAQLLKYFSNNKKGQLYKTCDKCRYKRKGLTCNNINVLDTIELLKQAQSLNARSRENEHCLP